MLEIKLSHLISLLALLLKCKKIYDLVWTIDYLAF